MIFKIWSKNKLKIKICEIPRIIKIKNGSIRVIYFRKKILMSRLIKQINFPADLRKFKKKDIKQI